MKAKTLLILLKEYISPVLQKEQFSPSPIFFYLIANLNKIVWEEGKECYYPGIYSKFLLRENVEKYIRLRAKYLLNTLPHKEKFNVTEQTDALRIQLFGELQTPELRQSLVEAYTGGCGDEDGRIHTLLKHIIQE